MKQFGISIVALTEVTATKIQTSHHGNVCCRGKEAHRMLHTKLYGN